MRALYGLLGLALALWVLWFLWRDARRCKVRRVLWRRQVTTMAIASRARSMEELPPAFVAELRQAMHLEDAPT